MKVDDTDFNTKLDKGEKRWSVGSENIRKAGLGMTAGITAPLLLIAGQAANSAGAIEAMGIKAQTVFGDSVKDVNNWADANARAMGLTSTEAAGLAANFGDLLVPMGFTREQAAAMSTDVVGLSGALAAWSGGTRTSAEVSEILAKAMLGERESLKELGISITEADVSARLLQKGQEGLTGAALEQAKAIATQELIFEKSKDAQAAFTDGTETLYEKQLKAKASTQQMKETLAKALTPAISAVTGLVSKLAGWFNDLPEPVKKIIFVFGGMAAAAGPILIMLPKLAQGVKMVSGVMKAVMSGNPYVLALMAIVTAVMLVIKYHDEIVAALRVAWDAIKGAFTAAKDFIIDIATKIWEFLKEWGPLILLAIAPVIGAPLLIIQHWEEIKTFFLETLPGWIKEALDQLYEWMVQPFVDLWTQHLQPWFVETWDKIKTFFTETLPNAIWAGLSQLYDWIVQPYVDLWNNHLEPWFTNTWNAIRDFFTVTLPAKIKEGLDLLYSWIVQPFVDIWQKHLYFWFTETWDKIKTFFTVTLPAKIAEGFNYIKDKFTAPFIAAWNWIKANIIEPIENFFGKTWALKTTGTTINPNARPGSAPAGRQHGGFVTRPEFTLIGEAGPELVLPLTKPARTQQLLAQAGLGGDTSALLAELKGLRRDLRDAPRTINAYGETGLQLGREIVAVLGGA